MARHHQLTIGTETKTLEQWGFSSCVVTVSNLRGDEMVLTAPATVSGAALMFFNSRVKLRDPDGRWQFVGLAGQPQPVIGDGGVEQWLYRIRGGSALLESTYKQLWRFPEEPPETIVNPDTPMVQELISLVTLFRDPDEGAKVTLIAQIAHIMEQAKAHALAEGVILDYRTDFLPEISPPEDEKRDLSFLDAIESCLRWCPHVCTYWDYSAGYPILRFSRPTVDTSGDPTKHGVLGHSYGLRNVPVTMLKQCKPVALDDRVVKEVSIEYLIKNVRVIGEDQIIYASKASDVSTAVNGSITKAAISIPLRGAIWDGTGYTAPEARPPDGLAVQIHQAFARVWWKFEPLLFVGEEPNWDYKIGEGWSVTGMGDGPAYAQAVAQVIARDIFTGETVLQCGPPTHLGLDDLIALFQANRLRSVPIRTGEQQFGFDRDPEDEATGGSEFLISLIEAGSLSDFYLKGRRA